MASSFFFNGRLWSTPTVMSLVSDNAMAPTSLTVGNILCLIGASAGGQPQTPLLFGNPSDALATLVSGPLCDAAVAAFNPSNQTNAPSTLMCVRVGGATQASAVVLDNSAQPVFTMTTNQYGLVANQVKFKIQAGSVSGQAVTIQVGNSFATQDNLGRTAFTIQYSGGQSTASMSITNSTVTLFAPNATPVATIALASFPTVQNLVDAINSTPGFAATVPPGLGNTAALNGLDNAVTVDVKTALYSAKANLQAIIDWINSAAEPYVTAVRYANVGTTPANIAFTYLSGGTSPAPITGDWTTALGLIQAEDVQWIVPLVADQAIWAACDAHCQFMSSVGRHERRCMVGPASGTSLAAVAAMPITINSDRTSVVWPGYYAFNAAGQRTLYDPFMTAAKVAAGFAGVNPGDAMTNKSLTVTGLELQIKDPVDTDLLIQSGVLCLKGEPTGFKVVRSISSWLVNNNFNRVEVSCGAAVDFTVRNVRNALDPLRGTRNDPLTLGRAIIITESALEKLSIPEPAGPGTLVGNAASPPFTAISASIAGDVLSVNFQASPVIPTNFIPITVAIVPFTGTQASTAVGQNLTS
jgi:hypothetical protein